MDPPAAPVVVAPDAPAPPPTPALTIKTRVRGGKRLNGGHFK